MWILFALALLVLILVLVFEREKVQFCEFRLLESQSKSATISVIVLFVLKFVPESYFQFNNKKKRQHNCSPHFLQKPLPKQSMNNATLAHPQTAPHFVKCGDG